MNKNLLVIVLLGAATTAAAADKSESYCYEIRVNDRDRSFFQYVDSSWVRFADASLEAKSAGVADPPDGRQWQTCNGADGHPSESESSASLGRSSVSASAVWESPDPKGRSEHGFISATEAAGS